MQGTNTEKKIIHIFSLMQKLYNGEEIYAQNERLCDEFGINERTLRRYLEDLLRLYGQILVIERKQKNINGKKVNVYRVLNRQKDISDTLRFFLEESNELSWIITMVHENDPRILNTLSYHDKEIIEKNIQLDKEIFLFRSNPFENLQDVQESKRFSVIKAAVKHREYRNIEYQYDQLELLENVKCLKLIFASNNWYLAIETEEGQFRLLRIAFIKKIHYAKDKTTYQQHTLAKYRHYFETMQNPMTLEGVAIQTAILKAHPNIKRYFVKGMKPFFLSQRYIETTEDDSVIFSIDYTQALEILPFIKQWSPSLELLEPQSLKAILKEELSQGLSLYN